MDMSLDDVIAKTKAGRGGRTRGGRGGVRGGRGGRGGGGFGGRGGGFGGRGNRAGFSRNVPDGKWQHDRFEGGRGGGGGGGGAGLRSPSSLNASSKLLISNLDFNVSDADIEELFGEFGPLKRASVHYERSGRSLGSAEVVFERRVDAQRAFKQYNNVPLDGRPMKISMVGPGVGAAQASANGAGGRVQNGQGGRPGGQRGSGGGGRGGGGRGRGRGGAREKKPTVTADDLDKELDAYVSKMDE